MYKIRMITRRKLQAAGTAAAGCESLTIGAEQTRRHGSGHRCLADAIRSKKEIGVAQAATFHDPAQKAQRSIVPCNTGKHYFNPNG